MESTIDELGKLKYSLDLEISLKEIKPTYDAIYRELKNILFLRKMHINAQKQ